MSQAELEALVASLLAGLSPAADQVTISLDRTVGGLAGGGVVITALQGGTVVGQKEFEGTGAEVDTFLKGFEARHFFL